MISCPVQASGIEPSDLYRSFFPWPQAVSSHTCLDQYCAEYLKETFHMPGFSLCPSLITGSLSHELQLPCSPWTFGFTSTVQGVGLRPPSSFPPWKLSESSKAGPTVGLTLFVSHLSGLLSFVAWFPVPGKPVFHVFFFFFPLRGEGRVRVLAGG